MHAINDWRLTNQFTYLHGVELIWRKYTPASEKIDHDHCEFCFDKFMCDSSPDFLTEGYATLDAYRWICKACYTDFAELFEWQLQTSA